MDAQEVLARVGETVSAGRSFGPVERHGDTLVVPVSFVVGGGGGGDKRPAGGGGKPDETGAGIGFVSWPLGVYVVREGDVKYFPTVDITGLAAVVLGLLVLRGAIKRLLR